MIGAVAKPDDRLKPRIVSSQIITGIQIAQGVIEFIRDRREGAPLRIPRGGAACAPS